MIHELIEQLENCTHAKVNFIIDEEYVNCDLGIYEEENFVSKYTSAVVAKTNLKDYAE